MRGDMGEMGGDGGRWEEMGGDGRRWEEMGGDGRRWEEMGKSLVFVCFVHVVNEKPFKINDFLDFSSANGPKG